MGLAIAWGVAMSLPLIGGPFATALWGGASPARARSSRGCTSRTCSCCRRSSATLIAVHLAMIMRQRHTQFPGPGRREDNVVGTPMWPGYALRSLGLFAAVAAVLVLMGGLIQINPVWLWGPYHPYIGTNGAQPDWYLGWLIGALRLMPNLEIHAFGHTLVPNPFFGGVLFPARRVRAAVCAAVARPALHHARTTAATTCSSARATTRAAARSRPPSSSAVAVVFAAGSADRLFFLFGFGYEGAICFFRGAFFVVPVIVFVLTKRICQQLAQERRTRCAAGAASVVRRNARGGFDATRAMTEDSPSVASGRRRAVQ